MSVNHRDHVVAPRAIISFDLAAHIQLSLWLEELPNTYEPTLTPAGHSGSGALGLPPSDLTTSGDLEMAGMHKASEADRRQLCKLTLSHSRFIRFAELETLPELPPEKPILNKLEDLPWYVTPAAGWRALAQRAT